MEFVPSIVFTRGVVTVAVQVGRPVHQIRHSREPADHPDRSGFRIVVACLALLFAVVTAAWILFSALENAPWGKFAEEAHLIPAVQNPLELFPHRRP